jgi:4-amino-4-deoxy-L-arabinose transferase-like glycosyltransferase
MRSTDILLKEIKPSDKAWMSNRKAAVTILILAFVIRLAFILLVPLHPLETDAKDYDRLGLSLSQGLGYVNDIGEPTAMRPPVYPVFLGAIYFIAGHHLFWVRLLQAILGAGTCLLTFFIATIVFDRKTAMLSGFLCCFYPHLIVRTSEIMSENLFAFLLLLGIWILMTRNSSFSLWVPGMIFGLALLTRSNLILLRQKRSFLKRAAFFISGVLLVLLPWTIRNYSRLHSFVPLANNGGITFYNSYIIPEKGFGFISLEGVDAAYYQIKDETKQSHYLMRTTLEYIRKNPQEVIKLGGLKLLYFIYPFDGYWYSISFGSKYNIFWGLIFCFSLIGIVNNIKDHEIHKKLIYFSFLAFLIGVIVFYGSPRFRLPIEPLLICFATSGMIFLFQKKRYAFAPIAALNIMLFIVFRYFDLQSLFSFLR